MAYTKTTWVEGGAPGVSAANLNKIEQGIDDALPKAGGTMSGNIAMNGNQISSVNQVLFVNGSKISESVGQRIAISAESDRFDVVTEDGVNFILSLRYATDTIQFKNKNILYDGGPGGTIAGVLSLVGAGDINLDDTSGTTNPTIRLRQNGIDRSLVFHDMTNDLLTLRANKSDGTANTQTTFKYVDGVTPTAHMNFPTNFNWLGTGVRAAMDLNNSDIIGANCIIFDDDSSGVGEGLLWPKTGVTPGSTTQNDYTNMRVDGAGDGWIGADQIHTNGYAPAIVIPLYESGSYCVGVSGSTVADPQGANFNLYDHRIMLDFDMIAGRAVYFEVNMLATSGTASATIYKSANNTPATDGGMIALSTASTSSRVLRSTDLASFLLSSKPEISIRLGNTATKLFSARLIIL